MCEKRLGRELETAQTPKGSAGRSHARCFRTSRVAVVRQAVPGCSVSDSTVVAWSPRCEFIRKASCG